MSDPLDAVLDAAEREWMMQEKLPDDEPAGMSEIGRQAYLTERLMLHLQNILLVSGRLKND